MKLSELTRIVKEKTTVEDPEILITTSMGFSDITEILHRNEYYTTTFFGKELRKGNFVCLECDNL